MHFGALDLSTITDKKFVQKYLVQGTPEFLIFKDPPIDNPYSKDPYRAHVLYSSEMGPTTALDRRSFKKYIKSVMPNYVLNIEMVAEDHDGPSVTLVTSNAKVAPLFKALSAYYYGQTIHFMQHHIQDTDKDVLEQYEVDDFDSLPALVMKAKKNGPVHIFDTSTKNIQNWADVLEFVDSGIMKTKENEGTLSDEARASTSSNGRDFQKTLEKTSYGMIVMFRYPDHEDSSEDSNSEEWKKTAKTIEYRYGHMIRLFDVDCSVKENEALCKRYSAKGGLRVFPFGTTKPRELQPNQVQSASSFEESLVMIESSIPSNIDILTSDADVNSFVLKCVSAKKIPIILFSKKYIPPVLFKALSTEFIDSAMFGLFPDPPAHVLGQYQITKLPAIVTVFEERGDKGVQPKDDGHPVQFAIAAYHKDQMGPMNFANVGRFISAVTYEVYPRQSKGPSAPYSPEVPLDDDIPLATAENFQKYCVDSAVLCAIGIFNPPMLTDEPTTDDKLVILEEIAQQTRKSGDPVQFLWIDGLCQHEFADQFDVQAIKIPTIVVFSPKKLRYATFMGKLTPESGRSFIRSIVTGRVGTFELGRLPSPVSDRDCSAFHASVAASSASLSVAGDSDEEEEHEDMDDMLKEIREEEEQRKAELEEQLQQELLERKRQEALENKEKKKKKKGKGKKRGGKKNKKTKKKIVRKKDEL